MRRAVRNFLPAEGDVFDHAQYERNKAHVEDELFDAGFMRAKATTRRVEVSRKANTANIDLVWKSGPRMRFGPVKFSESQFPPEFLKRYIPWKTGDWYSPDLLLAFQQRLIDADYFSAVIVEPDFSDQDVDRRAGQRVARSREAHRIHGDAPTSPRTPGREFASESIADG